MNIETLEAKPYERSVFPGISFEIGINYQKYQEAIVEINGWLEGDDKKILSDLKEEVLETQKIREIAGKGTHLDSQFRPELYKTTLVALLQEKALSYIEKRRKEDTKGDVKLFLHLNLRAINTMATISPIHLVQPGNMGLRSIEPLSTDSGQKTNWKALAWAYEQGYSNPTTNCWFVSGNGGPIFLAVTEQSIRKELRIPSTDWIHDYGPKLGLGEYFIVEIQKGDKTIERAWDYLEKAEEGCRTWNT